MSDCKHGLETGCAVCMRHKPTCTRWAGRWTCKDHGVQYSKEPESEPEQGEHRRWVLRPVVGMDRKVRLIAENQRAPWARGHAPSGEWPESKVKRTVVGPITKAVYNYDVPVYTWSFAKWRKGEDFPYNVTYKTMSGVGGSWEALSLTHKWWIRKETVADVDEGEHGESEFTGDTVDWRGPGLGDGGERFAKARADL